jgi:hypothetical protein
MPGPLTHTPAHILQKVLIALGQGTTPVAAGGVYGAWPIFRESEPDGPGIPDNLIAVINTAGVMKARRMTDGRVTEYHGVQVLVRSVTEAGYSKANALAICLDSTVYWEGVTIDGTGYVLRSAHRTSDVLVPGKRPGTKLFLYTVNAVLDLVEGDPDPVTVGELTDEAGDELLEGD